MKTKSVIVLVLTAVAIAVLFCLSGGLRREQSAAALKQRAEGKMGKADYRTQRDVGEDDGTPFADAMEEKPAAPAAAPPPPPQELEALMGSADKANAIGGFGGIGMRGSGKGGGGYGSGIGSIGTVGRGAVAKKEKAANSPAKRAPKPGAKDQGLDGNEAGEAAEAVTRAWFPETFLFQPLVVTDAQGQATVPVRVPDRLTNWRVLALAHSRAGSQAGAVTQFLGTLPTYIEPVVPPFLYAGDSVRLPVQVVNTTDKEVNGALRYQAVGATLSTAGGSTRVAAGANSVEYVTLTTSKPGTVGVKTTFGSTDAVERTIDVKPAGAPVVVTRGGTLAGPREFTLTAPANALPDSESLRLQVFPGALGLLRSELSAAPNRGGVAEDAYLLNLVGQAPALLTALGAEANTETLRDLSIVGTQRVMRYSRSPSVDDATLLARAALAHPENPVLQRLAERLSMQIAQAQRPDGTCQGANGWTLQRLLVTTGDCVRAATAAGNGDQALRRSTLMKVRAAGAIERNLARVNDGYTAASLLASGAASGTVADTLKAQIIAALVAGEDGAKYLPVDSGVVRADGRAPSQVEATAMAILALSGTEGAPLADLGTYLLSNYSPFGGWGDGRTNLLAMEAVMQLFKAPVPAQVKITLKRDGEVLSSSDFNAQRLQDVVTVAIPAVGSAGTHTWSISAEPPVAGLGYALALTSYVKWVADTGGGLELTTKLPAKLQVGRPALVELTAAAPNGVGPELRFSLPAGAQADSTQLNELVNQRKILRYETEDGAVTLFLPPFNAGANLFQAQLMILPTLAGKLLSAPSTMKLPGSRNVARRFEPLVWNIAG